jgi:Holliday junction DNA helicase RuvA
MIGKLSGTLSEKNPPQVLVDCQGVGYEVDVPMSTFYNLPAVGEKVSLLTHFVVREDAQILYGFGSSEERAAFRQLIKISGVGPRMALGVLSGMSVSELAQAITLQEAGRLVKIPGIGKKTAERIVLELKDKVGVAAEWEASSAKNAPSQEDVRLHDAVLALISLGYKQVEAHKAIRAVMKTGDEMPTSEELIRQALKILS